VAEGIEIPLVDPYRLAWHEMNDQGNADRFVAHAGGYLCHVRGWGWLAYRDGHWSREDGERLARLKAMEVARGMRDQVAALAERDPKDLPPGLTSQQRDERVEALAKFASQSGNANKTKAMLEQAAALDVLNRDVGDFDTDPLVINCTNGTLRFADGADGWGVAFRPHDPADLLTRQAEARWEPNARNAAFLTHIEQVQPDPDVRWFLQKLIGYAATGLTIEQIFVLLQGKGGDGKSTLMNAVRIVLGSYAVSGKVQTFIDGPDKDAGGPTPELVRLTGDTRMISLQEPKRGKALAEDRVKQFTGGSPVAYRALYGEEGEFEPRGKVFMECNKRPRISGDDDGIWRRIVIVLFRHQFKGKAIVKGMTQRILSSDGGPEGVLAWIVEGILGYLNEGLEQPEAVVDAIEEYRRSANPFSEWMAARLDLSDELAVELASDLYRDYKEWCQTNEVDERSVLSQAKFGRDLGDMQIILKGKDRKGRNLRRGARLRQRDEMTIAGGVDDFDGEPVL